MPPYVNSTAGILITSISSTASSRRRRLQATAGSADVTTELDVGDATSVAATSTHLTSVVTGSKFLVSQLGLISSFDCFCRHCIHKEQMCISRQYTHRAQAYYLPGLTVKSDFAWSLCFWSAISIIFAFLLHIQLHMFMPLHFAIPHQAQCVLILDHLRGHLLPCVGFTAKPGHQTVYFKFVQPCSRDSLIGGSLALGASMHLQVSQHIAHVHSCGHSPVLISAQTANHEKHQTLPLCRLQPTRPNLGELLA